MTTAEVAGPAWLALAMILGPLPTGEDTITARLCGGGAITIPLKRAGDQPPGQPREESCFKACHAGTCRKRAGRIPASDRP